MRVIVTAEPDLASRNMKEYFLKNHKFKKTGSYSGLPTYAYNDFLLVTSPKSIIHINDLDNFFDPEYYVFASPHSSVAGKPSLTAHCTGNFGKNEFGGNPKELAICPALLMKSAILNLKNRNLTKFPISLEVTHHGPTNLKKPLLFVEVGSSESEWNNQNAIKTVCKAILGIENVKSTVAIGFGGPHYAPNFTKRELNTELAFGHMCPKYALDNLNAELVRQMIEKTVPNPELAVLDWKGMKGDQRQKVINWLGEMDFPWEKI